ncbi:acyltransferase family protein [Halopseudomonas pachastrellae]|uniref:acyltransferase family protein n=1 Tax=Halopseudomonas pachastrellae TaxID=254161 RepID=UPI003D7D9B7B
MKINSIDAMRGVLAFFVVAIHLSPICCSNDYASTFVNSIARIAVPLFFAISGLLNYKTINKLKFPAYLSKSLKSVAIPYISVTVLGFASLYIFAIAYGGITFIGFRFPLSKPETVDFFLGTSGYPGLFHLWFLRNLFISMIIFYFIRINAGLFITGALFLASVILWGYSTFADKQIALLVEAISSFSAGYYLRRAIEIAPIKIKTSVIWIAIISSLELIMFYTGLQSFYRSFCVIFLMLFCLAFHLIYDRFGYRINTLLKIASTYSLPIYLFHLPFMMITSLLLKPSAPHGLFAIMVAASIIFSLTLSFSILLERLFPSAYRVFTGKI